ncbi:membrane-associated protein, putative [Bodo saltans]|uniref:EGF domain-specific O-linked N-acetylglucosamine transferase n=1 Tax=Bodo saltans TaxID=75058 RepID=A0A0S4JC71_BODSA|nr:membrane-associated protein, putative [Bodo saltans]|eukprot:CUG85800.1 membrane-associated protein, putative [Bodo saltans]
MVSVSKWYRRLVLATLVASLVGTLLLLRSFFASVALEKAKQQQQQQVIRLSHADFPTTRPKDKTTLPSHLTSDGSTSIDLPQNSFNFPDFSDVYDKNTTELVVDDAEIDGTLYNVSTEKSGVDGGRFISSVDWQGKCFYLVKNFCVLRGQLTLFHDPADLTSRTVKLRMCNVFTQHSPTIRLAYQSEPMPLILPAPLNTVTKGWMLQFWCQDMFHMTLSLMPAFLTKQHVGPHPDVFIKIARGSRRKGGSCKIKLGDPRNWEDVFNKKWSGGDEHFRLAGNPFWPLYQVLTPDPHRIFPLEPDNTAKSTCYTNGVIDNLYVKDVVGDQARNYSESLLHSLDVTRGPARRCRKYRLTLIDRRHRGRLTNTQELVHVALRKGFAAAQSVVLETLPIREQLRLISSTDVLMGMRGKGMTWLQFLQPGSAVVEMLARRYLPYAELWGHKHFHTSGRNNMIFVRGGERVPFAHNETEVELLLDKVLEHLDSTSCNGTFIPPNEKLQNLYRSCAPHCN